MSDILTLSASNQDRESVDYGTDCTGIRSLDANKIPVHLARIRQKRGADYDDDDV
jgi:hypothetical protein